MLVPCLARSTFTNRVSCARWSRVFGSRQKSLAEIGNDLLAVYALPTCLTRLDLCNLEVPGSEVW